MTADDAELQTPEVTCVTSGRTRGVRRRATARVTALARRLPLVRFVRVAEIVAARIQLGIGGVAMMIVAQLVGDLMPRRR